jgi:hypothetical protein
MKIPFYLQENFESRTSNLGLAARIVTSDSATLSMSGNNHHLRTTDYQT